MAPSFEERLRAGAEASSYHYAYRHAVKIAFPDLDDAAARAAAIERIVASGDARVASDVSAERLRGCLEALGLSAFEIYKATNPGVYGVELKAVDAIRSVLTRRNLGIARRIVGDADAEDVLQRVAIRIGKSPGALDKPGLRREPYTAKAVHRECLSVLRSRKPVADIHDPLVANKLVSEVPIIEDVETASDPKVRVLQACAEDLLEQVIRADAVLAARLAAHTIKPARAKAIHSGLRARIVNLLTGLPLIEGQAPVIHTVLTNPELAEVGLGLLAIEDVKAETLRVNVARRYRADIDDVLREAGLGD